MTISTHVLDTSTGRPAARVAVRLQRAEGATWVDVFRGATNDEGRVPSLAPADAGASTGVYRLTFDAGAYFQRRGVASFYREIAIDFVVRDDSHHHVPLLLSPFGYSTYRGS